MAEYDYDLFTIGAGSGGVRASRMSARFGARVAVAEERYLKVLASDVENGLFIINVDPPAGPSPDLDNDGDVDAFDLALLLGSWGPCADCGNCLADLDGDCTVGAADLAILLGNWGP